MISLTDVSVAVPIPGKDPKTLLTDVTAHLAEHRVALIGANGSGKSTFLRLLNGLIQPTTGTVTVDGIDVTENPRTVRKHVGFIFTDPLAQLVMATPADDISLSLRHTIRNRTQRTQRAHELLAERGLERVADQSVYDLSGGERQLVALTSVLAVKPTILVADEPTTLLDLRNRNRLIAELTSLPQQLIYSTHDLDFARTADRALLIDNGRIVEDGPPSEVISGYRHLMAQ